MWLIICSMKQVSELIKTTLLFLLSNLHPSLNEELNPNVQAYLDEHLLRSFNQKSTLTMKAGSLRSRNLRRRMSVKGAIKKTRSINVDCKYYKVISRSFSSILEALLISSCFLFSL